ncbi:MAG TPA: hypothetical protein VFU43_13735 [Streptosporangiaceae bacterium]|nr:hypothetical protein [Streptosporangiaceae bacterium]
MADPAAAGKGLVSDLVDLSSLPLEVVAELPPSVLGLALRRALETARRPDDAQSSYQKCISKAVSSVRSGSGRSE